MKSLTTLSQGIGLLLSVCVLASSPFLVRANTDEALPQRYVQRSEAIEGRIEKQHDRIEQINEKIEKLHLALIALKEKFGIEDEEMDGHHTATVEALGTIPTLDVIVHTDPKKGYNIELVTTNYEFAPQNASTEHLNGEGHSHLYVDGEKLTRVYGNWYYLKAFETSGHHTVRVELSANDHRAYAHEGVIIDDTENIMVE